MFSGLSLERLRALAAITGKRTFKAHEQIAVQGKTDDILFILIGGRAILYRTDARGREVILDDLLAGDCFGEMSLVDGLPHSCGVRACVGSTALLLQGSDFAQLLSEEPTIRLELLKFLTARLKRSRHRIATLSLLDARGRVEQALVDCSVQIDGHRVLRRRLSSTDLGKRAGCSREMAGRVLAEMKACGALRVRADGWWALDVKSEWPQAAVP